MKGSKTLIITFYLRMTVFIVIIEQYNAIKILIMQYNQILKVLMFLRYQIFKI